MAESKRKKNKIKLYEEFRIFINDSQQFCSSFPETISLYSFKVPCSIYQDQVFYSFFLQSSSWNWRAKTWWFASKTKISTSISILIIEREANTRHCLIVSVFCVNLSENVDSTGDTY